MSQVVYLLRRTELARSLAEQHHREIVGEWLDGTPLARWQEHEYSTLEHAIEDTWRNFL